MPLIMSAYIGIAKKAFAITQTYLRSQTKLKRYAAYQLGEMYNVLTEAIVMHKDMIRLTKELDNKLVDQIAVEMLSRKTNVANACIKTLNLAFATVGGKAYYRSTGLEILFRNVQAAQYHPLAEKDQQLFTGEYLLKSTVK